MQRFDPSRGSGRDIPKPELVACFYLTQGTFPPTLMRISPCSHRSYRPLLPRYFAGYCIKHLSGDPVPTSVDPDGCTEALLSKSSRVDGLRTGLAAPIASCRTRCYAAILFLSLPLCHVLLAATCFFVWLRSRPRLCKHVALLLCGATPLASLVQGTN